MIKALMFTDMSGLILLSLSQLLMLSAIFTEFSKARILIAFSIFFMVAGLIFAYLSTWYYGL